MPEHILFLTGKLAEKSLSRVLDQMQPSEFTYRVLNIGISVAGLMTADFILRRLPSAGDSTRIMVPGRCRGNLDVLADHYGVPVVRGPEELKDLPQYFGRSDASKDLNRYDVRIFAEIHDAPQLSVEQIMRRAENYRNDGADVIDLGCLPDTPFQQLEEAVSKLKASGYQVSVDSVVPKELLRAGKAGADFLLSLTEDTLWVAEEVASTPVLIPQQSGNLASLERAMKKVGERNRSFIADPVLDPIHIGFVESLMRYYHLRRRHPETEIMMGVGNITELTDADTTGINALLMGIISELHITNILTTEVSPHARRAVREADVARRIMYAAREASSLPRDFSSDLLTVHARKPFPDTAEEIAELAGAIKDPSYRIQVSEQGIHIYNRDGLRVANDPFALFPLLNLENDAAHAFYLGVELARAQIAWQLAKRYNQDEELDWGCAVERKPEDLMRHRAPGTTLEVVKKKAKNK
ncbi:MAG TPA: DUF6513 domain-containing protein [Burkholderiales bacterium]|nr:DUF6513 domain-containing protein [Burkholderiales bacterium]